LVAKIKEVTEDKGIDMYFENVGGMHFEAAFETLREHGRIAVCGAISEYNYGGSGLGGKAPPNNIKIAQMIYSFQRIEGFVCSPWLKGERGNFHADMAKWVGEGKIQIEQTFFDGVEQWPVAFAALFTGQNTGKVVVRTEFYPAEEAGRPAS